jgi:hypothetical protein
MKSPKPKFLLNRRDFFVFSGKKSNDLRLKGDRCVFVKESMTTVA